MGYYGEAREQQRRLLERLDSGAIRERPGDIEGRHYFQSLTHALLRADPYYFSAPVCDLVQHAASSLPHSIVTRDLIPHDLGFWWFATPLRIARTVSSHLRGVRAISWVTVYRDGDGTDGGRFLVDGADGPARGGNAELLHVCFWVEDMSGVLQPVTHLPVYFDRSWESTLTLTITGRDPESVEERGTRQQKLTQFLAGLYFIRQRVVVRQRETLSRGERRRLPSDDRTTDTTVIYLRRQHSRHSPEAGHIPVDWSCRWWVDGHWRQQPCGVQRSERRATWVTLHLKGPDDKPIRAPRRIFAVIR